MNTHPRTHFALKKRPLDLQLGLKTTQLAPQSPQLGPRSAPLGAQEPPKFVPRAPQTPLKRLKSPSWGSKPQSRAPRPSPEPSDCQNGIGKRPKNYKNLNKHTIFCFAPSTLACNILVKVDSITIQRFRKTTNHHALFVIKPSSKNLAGAAVSRKRPQ